MSYEPVKVPEHVVERSQQVADRAGFGHAYNEGRKYGVTDYKTSFRPMLHEAMTRPKRGRLTKNSDIRYLRMPDDLYEKLKHCGFEKISDLTAVTSWELEDDAMLDIFEVAYIHILLQYVGFSLSSSSKKGRIPPNFDGQTALPGGINTGFRPGNFGDIEKSDDQTNWSRNVPKPTVKHGDGVSGLSEPDGDPLGHS